MFDELDRLNLRNGSQLVLKVGIHRGDALVVSDRYRTDYFGQTVNIAARTGAIATPCEIVLSDSVLRSDALSRLLAGREIRAEMVTLKGCPATCSSIDCRLARQVGQPQSPDLVSGVPRVRRQEFLDASGPG